VVKIDVFFNMSNNSKLENKPMENSAENKKQD